MLGRSPSWVSPARTTKPWPPGSRSHLERAGDVRGVEDRVAARQFEGRLPSHQAAGAGDLDAEPVARCAATDGAEVIADIRLVVMSMSRMSPTEWALRSACSGASAALGGTTMPRTAETLSFHWERPSTVILVPDVIGPLSSNR